MTAAFCLPAAATAGDRPGATHAPGRIISMNLCTDQLALLLAAPGQLVSVSVLAQDPLASAAAASAAALPGNHGMAEEIFLMRPDLVLAGSYTRPATVGLLRRLGIEVVLVEPTSSLEGVRQALRDVGTAMGRQEAAARAIAEFDAGLARLAVPGDMAGENAGNRPRAALYYANGYTTGERTLAGDILAAAGLGNVADGLGLEYGGVLALEQLILARPDAVILGQRYPGRSRAEDLLDHPALRMLMRQSASATVSDPDWLCGTPHVLRAVAQMAALRERLE